MLGLLGLVIIVGAGFWLIFPSEPEPIRRMYVLDSGVDSTGEPVRRYYIVSYPTSTTRWERTARRLGLGSEPEPELPPELAAMDSLKEMSGELVMQVLSEITRKNLADIARENKAGQDSARRPRFAMPTIMEVDEEELKFQVFQPTPFAIDLDLTTAPGEAPSEGLHVGRRSQTEILEVVEGRRTRMNRCIHVQKSRYSKLAGKLEVELLITRKGTVKDIKVISSQWNAPIAGDEVETCLKRHLASMVFSSAESEQRAIFTLMFM